MEADAIARLSGGLPGALARLGAVFLRTLPAQLGSVRASLHASDMPSLREAAHKLVTTVSAFSTAAGAHVILLEDAAERGDVAVCTALVARLDTVAVELTAEVEQLARAASSGA